MTLSAARIPPDMTPLQVIMLGHEMRLAQKAFQASLKGEPSLGTRLMTMAELEDKFDAAIEPYVNYHKAVELQETDHDS